MEEFSVEDALAAQERAAEAAANHDQPRAIEWAERAVAIMEEAEGPTSPDLANLLTELASYYDGAARYPEALGAAARASSIAETLETQYPGDPVLAEIRLNAFQQLGTALRNAGDLASAEAVFGKQLELAREVHGPGADSVANAHNSLGVVCKYAGRFDEGRQHYAAALAILEAAHGVDSLATSTIWHNIGGLLHSAERYAEAEEPGRKAWEIRRRYAGDDVPETWFDAVAYAGILDGLERYEESEPIYRAALARYEDWFGPNHFEVAALLHNLAFVLAARGDSGSALAMIRRSHRLKCALFPEGHFERRITAGALAEIEEIHQSTSAD